jgi:hypothetical protein
MKFTLDTKLESMLNAKNAQEAENNPFAAEVLEIDGVASVFGVNDFITVTRHSGAEWEPIIAAVQVAAAAHL